MKRILQFTIICLTAVISNACQRETVQFDEYVFAIQLVNDPIKIQEYIAHHKTVWPEVEAGFRKAGYTSIRLYRFENYVTMVIKVPRGTDIRKIATNEALNTEKIKAWNKLMATYQQGLPGAGTWVAMDKLYEFQNPK
ncbi:L-rhamnose mutarotase [Anseongella ginsenosidimutans]|uniref:L-rhamnose mutarotase n=1 Tax=Anseongella ginsenosidimutans TaxID=496056 RepID=A0A4R3KMZ0_9SPHI|nr:L-rhamnose mutarotase [Anseongella ginsenosidimutans]QEC51935.1 L-rhamnose mutarotase [Anseongella ginsenosidimutans]TCS85034.1 L-rhamnose mutarotase [Anseongella ginsenosidimutans]